jgi:hypothetical protein
VYDPTVPPLPPKIVLLKPYKTIYIDSDNYMDDKVEITILGRMGTGNHEIDNVPGLSRYTETLYWFCVVIVLVFIVSLPWIWVYEN